MPLNSNLKGLNLLDFFSERPMRRTNKVRLFYERTKLVRAVRQKAPPTRGARAKQ